MTIAVGDKLPDVKLVKATESGPEAVQSADFFKDTALALLDTRSGHAQIDGVPTHVRFRDLSDDEIRRYVERERPLDCAGSAKSEGLGITLLEAMSGDDPTALIGLPLIALSRMLRAAGVQLP